MDEQVATGVILQSHALDDAGFGDNHLADGTGAFEGDELDGRRSDGLLPGDGPATGQMDEVNSEVGDSDGVKDGHAERRVGASCARP